MFSFGFVLQIITEVVPVQFWLKRLKYLKAWQLSLSGITTTAE